jgi:hypothetical protein
MLSAGGMTQASEVQKVGTTSMPVLRISTNVRSIGMGETSVAVVDDIQSIFWNPAGLIHLKGSSVYLSQINMPADIQFNTLAVAKNFGNSSFGIHLLSMTTGDMKVTTISHPEGTGENFMCYDVVAGVSWAQRLTDRFTFGLNLRVANSGLDDAKYTGALADLGTLYETSLRTLKVGMAVQNFGPDVKYNGSFFDFRDQGRRNREDPSSNSYSSAPPPTIYRLGLSANFFEMTGIPKHSDFDGLMALEMSHPNDNRERINFGVEFTYLKSLALRAGYKLRYKNVLGYDEERWTGGFGIMLPLPGDVDFIFDYAYMDFGLVADATDSFSGTPHRFSIILNF